MTLLGYGRLAPLPRGEAANVVVVSLLPQRLLTG